MKKLIIHPWLLALFPVIFLYNVNRDMLTISYIISPVIIVFCSSIAVFILINYFTKDKIRSAIITSLFFVFFFSFGHYINFVSPKLFFPGDIIINRIISFIFLFAWLLISAVLTFITWRTKKNLEPLNQYLNLVSIIIIFLQLSSLSIYLNKSNEFTDTTVVPAEKTFDQALPDIYYIILDGYGRNDVLKEIYSFDNHDFTDYLSNTGFYVASSSYANYPQTYLSMSSALNYDYLEKFIPSDFDRKSDDRRIYKDLIRDHKVYSFFKDKGYQFIGLPNTWIGTVNNQNVDISINPELSINNFNHLLINTTPLKLFSVNTLYYNNSRHQLISIFNSLPDVAKFIFPTFTYVHVMSPHPPFLFLANGEPNNPKIFTYGFDGDEYLKLNPDKEYYREKYVGQLKFLNQQVKEAIEGILSNSKEPPIIIIQSDHGPGLSTVWESPAQTNMKERLAILNAYYLPKEAGEQLYNTISPVNSFRIVLNSIFNTELDLLPDNSYFATWSQPYNYIEVKKELKY